MKMMIKSLVAGLLSTGCLIAHGETQTAGGQTVTAIETAAVNVCSNPTNVATSPKGCVTNQLIRFNHIMAEEAATAVMGFKGTNGKISVIERINAIHVTDSQENINRMREIFRELDVPSPILEEVFDRQIKYAKATDIKTRLEKIVTESQKDNQKGGVASNAVLTAAVSDTDCGMIRGKVLIVADEPSNKLIIITTKANMDFFDKVIKSLDVEATPEVEVIHLKYADAKDVEKMLNDLIGAGSSSSQSKNNQNVAKGVRELHRAATTRHPTQDTSAPARPSTNPTFSSKSNLDNLNKDNVKILADKRINSITVMACKADMAAIKRVVDVIDMKLSQVLLKTAIIQVKLDDDLQTGSDWIERGRQKFFDGDRLNIAAIIQAAKSDSRTKILCTPTLMTLDNKEALIEATETIYLLSSCHRSNAINSGEWVRNYQMRDIGLTMKVVPRINLNGTVVLTLETLFTTRGTDQNVPNESGGISPYATISECRRSCKLMAEHNQTIMMGGLTKKTNVQSESGIPVLKDIPWIGKCLFGSVSTKEVRSELLVFITPHVLDGAPTISPTTPNSHCP